MDADALYRWLHGLCFCPSVGLRFWCVSESRGKFAKQIPKFHPGASDSAGLGWGLNLCVSNQLPGEGDAADPGTALGELPSNQSKGSAPGAGVRLACLCLPPG